MISVPLLIYSNSMISPYPRETVDKVIADYESGKASRQIAKEHGMNHSTVCRMITRRGKKARNASESKRIYSIDETFFEHIDTPEKAQILGFIYADGCIAMKSETSGNLQIVLAEIDAAYLEWIKSCMKSNRPIWHSDYVMNDNRRRKAAWFTTSHPKIIRDLMALGVTPRKSLTIGFPTPEQVPPHLMGSFVLGAFEGDGCIYLGHCRKGPTIKASVTIAGSLPFNRGLQQWLADQGIDSSIREFPTKQGKPITVLTIARVDGIMRFYGLIYKDSSYRMERKHERFLTFKTRYTKEIGPDGSSIYHLLERKAFTPENKVRMQRMARSNGMITARDGHLKAPNGICYYTDAIKPFCRENELTAKHIYRVLDDTVTHHKGWTLPALSDIESARAAGALVEKRYRT